MVGLVGGDVGSIQHHVTAAHGPLSSNDGLVHQQRYRRQRRRPKGQTDWKEAQLFCAHTQLFFSIQLGRPFLFSSFVASSSPFFIYSFILFSSFFLLLFSASSSSSLLLARSKQMERPTLFYFLDTSKSSSPRLDGEEAGRLTDRHAKGDGLVLPWRQGECRRRCWAVSTRQDREQQQLHVKFGSIDLSSFKPSANQWLPLYLCIWCQDDYLICTDFPFLNLIHDQNHVAKTDQKSK